MEVDNEPQKTEEAPQENTEQPKDPENSNAEDSPPVEDNAQGRAQKLNIPPEVLLQLMDMGFSELMCQKALLRGGQTVELAVAWIGEHSEDADIDEPLTEAESKPKKPLTEEEKKAKVAELQEKMKQRREQEKEHLAKVERDSERRRVEQGKEMQKIKEERRAREMREAEEEHRKKKAEEARARAKVEEKLKKDRINRYGAEAEAEREKKEAEKQGKFFGSREQFADIFKTLKAAHPAAAKKAAETLLVYLGNITKNPTEEKYRKIKIANQAFQTRVATLTGGLDFLRQVGFEEQGEFLVLPMSDDNTLVTAAETELKVQLLML